LKKKTKLTIFGSSIIILLASLAVFNFTPLSSIVQDIGFEKEFLVKSDYVLKLGLLQPISGNDYSFINSIITNAYGVGVFQPPIKFEQETANQLAQMMSDVNARLLEDRQVPQIISASINEKYNLYPLFSPVLIAKIINNSYQVKDLMFVIDELDASAQKVCDMLPLCIANGDCSGIEGDTYTELCNKKPDKWFSKSGDKYVLQLKDIVIPTFKSESQCFTPTACQNQAAVCGNGICDGSETCSTCSKDCCVTDCGRVCVVDLCPGNHIPDANGCVDCASPCATQPQELCTTLYQPVCGILDSSYSVSTYSNSCVACENANKYISGECPAYDYYTYGLNQDQICFVKRVPQTEIIKLSNIRFEINQKTGDIFIALGQKGITEANAIEGRYQFEQYAYQLEHKDAMPITDWNGKTGYTVLSNNQAVVDAADGKISETSKISDLWYGIKKGEATSSPLLWINISHIAIIVILITLMIITMVA
jgi:hypothetical protein